MAEALTLARPYARAAFSLARQGGQLEAWSRWLGFAAQVAVEPSVLQLNGDPRFDATQAVALYLPPDCESESLFARFLGVLAEVTRLPLLAVIQLEFEQLKYTAEGRIEVRVSSAKPLSAEAQQRLCTALSRRYGRGVELLLNEDPDLIGGVRIEGDGEVIDTSVQGRLQRLAHALVQ